MLCQLILPLMTFVILWVAAGRVGAMREILRRRFPSRRFKSHGWCPIPTAEPHFVHFVGLIGMQPHSLFGLSFAIRARQQKGFYPTRSAGMLRKIFGAYGAKLKRRKDVTTAVGPKSAGARHECQFHHISLPMSGLHCKEENGRTANHDGKRPLL